jgi:hypothetical protein
MEINCNFRFFLFGCTWIGSWNLRRAPNPNLCLDGHVMELETFFPSHLHPSLLNPHWSGRLALSQPEFVSASHSSQPACAPPVPPEQAILRASRPSRFRASLLSELAAPRASHPRAAWGWMAEREKGRGWPEKTNSAIIYFHRWGKVRQRDGNFGTIHSFRRQNFWRAPVVVPDTIWNLVWFPTGNSVSIQMAELELTHHQFWIPWWNIYIQTQPKSVCSVNILNSLMLVDTSQTYL